MSFLNNLGKKLKRGVQNYQKFQQQSAAARSANYDREIEDLGKRVKLERKRAELEAIQAKRKKQRSHNPLFDENPFRF